MEPCIDCSIQHIDMTTQQHIGHSSSPYHVSISSYVGTCLAVVQSHQFQYELHKMSAQLRVVAQKEWITLTAHISSTNKGDKSSNQLAFTPDWILSIYLSPSIYLLSVHIMPHTAHHESIHSGNNKLASISCSYDGCKRILQLA